MRISNRYLLQEAIRHIQGNTGSLHRAEQAVSDGRRVRRVSDAPIDASQIMRWEARIRDIDQYRRNAVSAEVRLSTEDAVLTSMREMLDRAKDLALLASDQGIDDPDRQTAAAELEQVQEQMIALANTRIGGEYLFGGGKSDVPPFESDGTYLGDSTVRSAEIDDGLRIETSHSGDQLFSDALKAVNDLTLQLAGGTREELQGIASDLAEADRAILGAQSETGARMRAVEAAAERLASRTAGLEDRRDSVRNVDSAEAIIHLLASQTALEQSYEALGRVLSLSIVNYLR